MPRPGAAKGKPSEDVSRDGPTGEVVDPGPWVRAREERDFKFKEKRLALLRAAGRVFNAKGYHNTSLDDIAQTLGITKTALYYYVKNKEELLYECLSLTYDCSREARQYAEDAGGTSLDVFCNMQRRFIELLLADQGAYTVLADMNVLPEERRNELLDHRRDFTRYNRKLLDAAVAEGSLRQVDTRLAASFMLGAANWLLRWYDERRAGSATDVANAYLDIFLRGVAIEGSPARGRRKRERPTGV